jgi:hypothetical protein
MGAHAPVGRSPFGDSSSSKQEEGRDRSEEGGGGVGCWVGANEFALSLADMWVAGAHWVEQDGVLRREYNGEYLKVV